MPSWIVFEVVLTKLPHYVLPLYPVIAILIAGAVELRVSSRRPRLVRGVHVVVWVSMIVSMVAVVTAVMMDSDLALLAWPFFAASSCAGYLPGNCTMTKAPNAHSPAPRRRGADRDWHLRRGRAVAEPAFPSVALAQVFA